ncbi:zinc ribbon domain-containing protein [Streptomyces sp. NPDC000983]|uniref:zinc ribbon domain-containing protein n=1 Tax=Streptomyces sp. NPDC000983 TaxID=3154373 RepID=UPI0033228252
MSTCPSCAAPIAAGHAFCSSCGAAITVTTATAATPPPMPPVPPAPPSAPQTPPPPVPPSAPVGPVAPGRAAVWFERVRPDNRSAKAAAVGALSALGSQLALLFVVIVLVAQFALEEDSGTVGDWLISTVWVACLALRGTLSLTLEGSSASSSDSFGEFAPSGVAGQGEFGLTVQVLLFTCTGLLAVWWFARRDERRAGADTWARVAGRSATGALVYAVALGVLALATHSSAVYGMSTEELGSVSVDLGVSLWPLLAYTLLFVFLADLAGRALVRYRAADALPGTAAGRLRAWRSPVVAAGTVSAVLLGLSALTALGFAVFGDTGDLGTGAALGLSLLTLVNSAVMLAGVAMGVTVGGSLTGAASVESFLGSDDAGQLEEAKAGLFTGGMPGPAYLLLLAVALVVVLAAVRHALAHDPRERLLPTLWRFAVVMAVVWVPLGVVSGLSAEIDGGVDTGAGAFGASGSAHGSVTFGLSLFGTLFVALAWGALLLLAAQFLTRPLLSAFPATGARVLRLPGLPVHPQWAALLADAARRKGRTVPGQLTDSETEPLACPPLATDAKWARLTGVGLVAAVVLGGGGTAAWAVVGSQVYGPEAAAEDYLRAVAEGRAEDALALLDRAPSGPLLTEAALDSQREAAALTEVSVGEVDESDTTATVTVTYSVDGQERETSLLLVADEDDHFGLWRSWKVSDGLGSVDVTASGLLDEVEVNGVQVPLEDGYAELTVFPGLVTVEGVNSGYLSADGGGSVLVEPGGSGTADGLEAALTEEGEQAARTAVLTELAQCAERSTTLEPEDCPLAPDTYYSSLDEAEDVRWTQKSEPDVETELAEDGTVTAYGELDFEVRWVAVDTFADTEDKQKDTSTGSFTATVDLSGGSPTVTFEPGYGYGW